MLQRAWVLSLGLASSLVSPAALASQVETVVIDQGGTVSGAIEVRDRSGVSEILRIGNPGTGMPSSQTLTLRPGTDVRSLKLTLVPDNRANLPQHEARVGELKFEVEVGGDRDSKLKNVKAELHPVSGDFIKDVNCSKLIRVARPESRVVRISVGGFRSFIDCDLKDHDRYDPSAVSKRRFMTPVEGRLFKNVPLLKGIELKIASEDTDRRLGRDFERDYYNKNYGSILPETHPVTQYVRRLTRELIRAADTDMKSFDFPVYVVNADVVNAFAVPGGPLYVFRGLLEAVENEAQLAGVMAHEIAHVTARHYSRSVANFGTEVAQRLITYYGVDTFILRKTIKRGVVRDLVRNLGAAYLVGDLIAEKFHKSQAFELEADMYGSQYAQNAGHEPFGLAGMFEIFRRQRPDNGNGFLERTFRTHPTNTDRINRLLDLTGLLYPVSASYRDPRSRELEAALRELRGCRRPSREENDRVFGLMESGFREMTQNHLDSQVMEDLGKVVKIGD